MRLTQGMQRFKGCAGAWMHASSGWLAAGARAADGAPLGAACGMHHAAALVSSRIYCIAMLAFSQA
jgi:hypothetical protein